MRSAAVPTTEFTPVFDWTPPRRRKIALFIFIAASTALHALCFYLFQIIYPPTVSLLPPPARVNIITGNSESGRVLLRWIEAEDPALSSMTQRSPDAPTAALLTAEHEPSYANHLPALREPPVAQPNLRVPSAQPPGPVQIRRPVQHPAPVITPTQLRFGPEAEKLGPAVTPPLRFTGSGTESLQPAEFRVAVNGAGEVRYCFLSGSSGDRELDAQAARFLALSRFQSRAEGDSHPPDGLLWTTATFEWGNDLAPPPANPGAPPAP